MKHVVRVLVFFLTLAGCLALFTWKKGELTSVHESTAVMTGTRFPVLFIEDRGELINPMHGYASAMEEGSLRESLTPVTRENPSVKLVISEDGYSVRRLTYRISDLSGQVLTEENVLAFNEEGGQKYCQINCADLRLWDEYSLAITVTTETNKNLHYYTRVKMLEEDYFREKLSFVTTFLHNSMSEGGRRKVAPYLETLASEDLQTLSYVNVNCSSQQVCWGGLMPQIHKLEVRGVGTIEVVPRVLEMSGETASFSLSYLLDGVTDDGTELFEVREFYRIRYTPERTWLLNFERETEQFFDPADAGNSENALKLGIRKEDETPILTNESGDYVAFVQNRELWLYQVASNKLRSVFSVRNPQDPVRSTYDQFGVELLDIDKAGNLDFMVVGYACAGEEEGKVGIRLFRYDTQEDLLREKVMIPLSVPYEMVKDDVGSFAYVNASDVFYFAMNETIYAYDISARRLSVIAEGCTEDSFVASEASHYVAWQETADVRQNGAIHILDLENGTRNEINAPAGQSIMLLGKSYENLIYGLVRRGSTEEEGSAVSSAYRVVIADAAGGTIKDYERNDRYVTGVSVEDNIVTLHLVNGAGEKADDDYIINQISHESRRIHLSQTMTDTAYREYFITIGKSSSSTPVGSQVPQNLRPTAVNEMPKAVTAGIELEIDTGQWSDDRYYIYAGGHLNGYCESAAEAVAQASELGGTAAAPGGRILWSRADWPVKLGINSLAVRYDEIGESSLATCAAMILAWERENVADDELKGETDPVKLLSRYLEGRVFDLTGRELSEMFYYVGRGLPVICRRDEQNYVLLYGYDGEYVKYADPSQDKTMIVTQKNAEKMFEDAGREFFVYIR
ncbi:MAG: hypothetical protein IJU99_06000 [Lachnospiraceae bacterium]|nr:hypothetical protein [Lachnospiraceae bacterium]